MRVLVCGGRDYDDEDAVRAELQSLPPCTIVHGDARGADRLADRIAAEMFIVTEPHPADWTRYGKAAGPIRNQEMLDSGINLVIAFPGGSGTADMVRRARKAGVEIREILAKPVDNGSGKAHT